MMLDSPSFMPTSSDPTCPRCGASSAAEARFCGACGAPLAAACLHCGTARLPGLRYCTGCGREHDAEAAPGASAEGERRQATVVFSDLSGYTAWNESTDPEEVEATMARVREVAGQAIERHGGTVNQFVGDEIMAIFGVPVARGDDARRAVAAAFALHRAVEAALREAAAARATGAALTMHTGINSGLVVVRRSDARAGAYVLTGDTVNTAARLRSLAEPGEIVAGAATWRQVSAFFEAEVGPPVAVKGKEQPLVAFSIRAERAAPLAGDAPLVGRGEEVRDFAAIARACAERRRGRVVIVRGDPGVGKTRLLAEFLGEGRALGFACHSASVLDFGAETGRDAVRSLARSLLGVAAAASNAERQAAVERVTLADRLEADRQLFLYDLVDVPPPPALRALAAAMSTNAREKGSVAALCERARCAGERGPVLFLVEDIHWADAWALERLAALAHLAAGQPLLLVMTTRFSGDPSAGAWRSALHGAPLLAFDLGALSAEDSMQLAVAASKMPPELVGPCVERAEGNPLFLLQLLLNAGEAVGSNLPGSIQALVHARMDRLAPADKAALQAAAVLGQRYSLAALRHLIDNPGFDCRILVEHFLVRDDGGELLFCHALIRDGAYGSLLHSRRRQLHERAADWFAARDLVLAAEHFDRAEHPRAALAYLAAGEELTSRFRLQQALGLVERGIELAAGREARFALLIARGRLLVELGRAGEAIEACRQALEASADPGERARALIGMASGMRLNERIDDGLAALDQAEPLAARAALPLELSRLHHLRGNLLFPLGRHEQCLREHALARSHARAAGSLEAEAAALGGLGDAHYLQGHMRSAHAQFRECVALSRQHGFGRLEVANLPMVGWSLHHLNDIAAAVEIGLEAIALATQASQPRAELTARALVSWMDGLIRDRRESAEAQIETALRLSRGLGAKRFEAQLLGVSAVLALRAGDRARARSSAAAALDMCRAHGMGHIGPWIFGVNALIEPDPAARARLLGEGEAQLGRGSVSHNHISLRELAIEVWLEIGDGPSAELEADRIQAYTLGEPLPLADFIVGRGRALARFSGGERSAALQARLRELLAIAEAAELNAARPALASALATFEAATGVALP